MAAGTRTRGGSRRRRDDGDDGTGRWLTTYADAVTLLMAFFVLLYAMSEIDVIKFTAFVEGLRVPFGNEAGDGLLPATDGLQPEQMPTSPQLEPPDSVDRMEAPDRWEQPEMPEVVSPDTIAAAERRTEANDQLDEVAAALDQAMREAGLEPLVEQRREERGLVVSIASDDVLFALGSTRIDDLGRQVIRIVSRTLDGFPNPLLVEGHTDDIPLNRSGYTNWNLSTDRAVAVLQLMIEEHGLPPDRVGAVGYGEHHPLEDNASASGRAANRRVDIVVLIEEDAL
jgi:chemotaxis protein MotB